jgi:multidrug efflux pump subunit AcrA (membrane-fusion protein)
MKGLVVEPDDAVGTERGGNSHGGEHRPPPPRASASWPLRIGALAVLAAAATWAYYANVYSAKPAMDMNMRVSAGDAAFPIVAAAVERAPVSGVVTYTGAVAAFNEEDIFPRVTGRIVEMLVYPGDAVRAGQVVARLDDVELTSRVREAEAMAATAQANRAQMEADVTASGYGVAQMEREQAMVEAELAYASGVRGRSERLVASGAISRQEYENDRSLAQALEAKREAARAKLEQARAMETSARRKLDAAESMVTQGRAAERTAQIVRDYVSIVAPTSGSVVKRLVAPGVLVQPGMAILKIAQVDRVRLQANVGEKDIALIRVGSPVTVRTTAGQSLNARVTSVFPFVDQGSRTAVVEAIVDNRDRRLLPGQYVTMAFVTGERAEAITVPRGAVARLGGAARVWVVSEDRVEPREVTTGLEGNERVEIVRGLTGSERVVARGHEGLYAGARVREATATTPPAGHSGHGSASGGSEAGGNAPVPPSKPDQMKPAPKEGGHAGH